MLPHKLRRGGPAPISNEPLPAEAPPKPVYRIALTLFDQGSHSSVPFDRAALIELLEQMRPEETIDLQALKSSERPGEFEVVAWVTGGPRDRRVIGRTGKG